MARLYGDYRQMQEWCWSPKCLIRRSQFEGGGEGDCRRHQAKLSHYHAGARAMSMKRQGQRAYRTVACSRLMRIYRMKPNARQAGRADIGAPSWPRRAL